MRPRTPSIITGPASLGSRPVDKLNGRGSQIKPKKCRFDVIRSSILFKNSEQKKHVRPQILRYSKSADLKSSTCSAPYQMFIHVHPTSLTIALSFDPQDLWTHHLSIFPWCGDRHATHLRRDGLSWEMLPRLFGSRFPRFPSEVRCKASPAVASMKIWVASVRPSRIKLSITVFRWFFSTFFLPVSAIKKLHYTHLYP